MNYLYSGDYDDKLTPTLEWDTSFDNNSVADLTSEAEAEFTDGEDIDLPSESEAEPASKKAVECCPTTDDTVNRGTDGASTDSASPTSKIESATSSPGNETISPCTTLNSQLSKAGEVPFGKRRSSRIEKKRDSEGKVIAEENSWLKANAYVFMLAEYYQLPGLKDLAAKKFAIALTNFNIDGFSEVLSLIYGSVYLAMARELREGVTAVVIQHVQSLARNEAFSHECLRQPTVLVDALPGLASRRLEDLRSAIDLRTSLTQQTDLVKTLNNDLSKMRTDKAKLTAHLAGVKRVYTQMSPNRWSCTACGFYPPSFGDKWCCQCRNNTVEVNPEWPAEI